MSIFQIKGFSTVSLGPVWSPDGTRIAFSMTTPRVYRADIYTSLPEGTDLQQVTNTEANEIDVDWGLEANKGESLADISSAGRYV